MSFDAYRFAHTGPPRFPSAQVHPWVRRLARALWVAFVAVVSGLLLAPWQQSVTGSGRVIAYDPVDRAQLITAPIQGRIVRWHVQEGDVVEAGDPIADITDNDPLIIERLEREREAAVTSAAAARTAVTVAESRVSSLESARDAAVASAGLYAQIAEDMVRSAEQELEAADAAYRTATLNDTRQRELGAEGLSSQRMVELAALELETTARKRASAEAKLAAARREVRSAFARRANVASKEEAEVAKANEALSKLHGDVAKAEAQIAKAEVKVSRQRSMQVEATRAGTVLRLVANGPGEFVKAGDVLARLVPDTASRAVELWVSGNDAPLITPGRQVRLQFQGWPAVQFVGWPSVAVGTFGAEVAFVDATDDGEGNFRVLVVPTGGEEWPDARYLRQGVRANGWVLLNRVSVAFELWRQLNGFPPALDPQVAGEAGPGGKEKETGG